MKKYALLILILFAGSASAQSMKYKDLFPLLEGMGKEELKNSLKEYLTEEDLDHPNGNFRLALVYELNYKHADVLTQYEYAVANAQEALLGFSKVKLIVDEREVSRNNEYYFPIFKTYDSKGKPHVEFEAVSKKLVNGFDSAQMFLNEIPAIYQSFTRSVNYYDNAVKIFSAMNSAFLSLDDLYLYYDPEIEKKLNLLKHNYDSARIFFDRYMELTKAYPIPYHKQKYHVKPIVTYRLDGLITRMNFLTNDIEFWDYGAWVDNVHKSVSAEIVSLRARLNQNEVRLDDNLAKISSSSNGEGISPVVLDKQLVFNLNNYDKQSLVLALLEYKSFKQDWLLKSKTLVPDTINLDRNAGIFSTLIYSNKSADTLINAVKNRLTPEKVRKHHEFITQHYGGMEGLQKYDLGEREYIHSTYGEYTSRLRSALVNIVVTPVVKTNEKLIRFGKWNVASTVHALTPELLEKGEPITLQSRKNTDGSIYLAGIYKPDKRTNTIVTFVAHVSPDGKPGWIQNFNFTVDSLSAVPDANNYLGPFELTQEGCAFIVRSVRTNQSDWRNSFIYLNEKGEQKLRIRLKEKAYPRKINFIEKSNSFVSLFKGQDEKPDYTTVESVTLVGINALGDVLWKRVINLAGTVADFINLIDGHLLVGNYMILKDLLGREHKTKEGESNPFLVRFNERGDIEKIHPVGTSKSVYVTNVVKVNDNSINLLGVEGNYESSLGKTISSDEKLVHIMTNRFCQVICSNY